ncbi:nucleotide sugar dehydrogenase, partial [Acidipropionibacterium jensenii]
MKIAVVAMGKIGLPLAVQFAEKGHDVIGVDVQQRVVDEVNKGNEPFPGEAFLDEKLKKLVPAGKLHATLDYAEAIPGADAVVLVVPLFVNDETWEPDFGWMDTATKSLAEHLTPGTVISYETTLPVGTTRNRWKPMIEKISGLKEGKDFTLVFSPERVLTGRVFADLRRYPKLVGGLSPEGTAKGIALYEQLLDFDERPDLPRPNGVWTMGTAEAAEMAKLAETTYRDVNIGLANQFGKFAAKNGIDVYKVIDACNSQPYSHIHRPGIAV